MASVGLGFGIAGGQGYPNEVSKIDDPDYRTTADPAFGSMNSIWIGGALRDWFTFGLGLNGFGAKDGDLTTQGSAFILHVEAFPLYNLGGKLRDLAFYTDFGAGGLIIEGGPEKAEGGFTSYLGAGSSFELWRLGYFALGRRSAACTPTRNRRTHSVRFWGFARRSTAGHSGEPRGSMPAPANRRAREVMQQLGGNAAAAPQQTADSARAGRAGRARCLSYTQRVERGRVNVTLGTLVTFADALKVPPGALLKVGKAPVIRRGRPPANVKVAKRR